MAFPHFVQYCPPGVSWVPHRSQYMVHPCQIIRLGRQFVPPPNQRCKVPRMDFSSSAATNAFSASVVNPINLLALLVEFNVSNPAKSESSASCTVENDSRNV